MERFRSRLYRRSTDGFTLIEVLLVVVIIGILVGVALPRIGGRKRQAEIARVKADIQNIGLALRMYEVDNGKYPPNIQALLTPTANGGPYLEQGIPKDPWGQPYNYQQPGSRNPYSYDLSSAGPPGEGLQIGNWEDTSN